MFTSRLALLGAALALAANAAYADDGHGYSRHGYSQSGDDHDDDDHHDDDRNKITIIHTGDFHGHLTPRPNLRSNAPAGQTVGGLARIARLIDDIKERAGEDNVLVMHTGDTIQGSGEALYTRGKAIVDVVDKLGIDAYAPGNWDFVYGPARFKELFVNSDGTARRWGGLVANLYEQGVSTNPAAPPAPKNPGALGSAQDSNVSSVEYDNYANWYLNYGKRLLKPYTVKKVNGVKIGILGCTTSRGPQVVGSWVTQGLAFTDCSREIPKFAEELRTLQGAKFVVLISEIEIGRNIQIMKSLSANQHVDLVLNSDMHEEALQPIRVVNPGTSKETLIIESGMDGTLVGEVILTVKDGQVTAIDHKAHLIDDSLKEDKDVAEKVAKVRKPYNEGFDKTIPCTSSSPYWNPFTEATCLNGPLSEVVGNTHVGLHRGNYSHEGMPAAVEGSSHDFIADAIRWWSKADLATVRGFRYGTHVKPGPITRNDLFHFVPIGPRVGKASRVVPNQIRNQIDNSSLAVFSSDPNNPVTPLPRYNNDYGKPGTAVYGTSPGAGMTAYGTAGNSLGWGGGWLFAYSAEGFHMDFAPYFQTNWQSVRSGAPVPPAGSTTIPSGIYLDIDPATGEPYNVQITNAGGDTSRARSLTVKMLCKYLPPKEQAAKACNVDDLDTLYSTTLTTAADGKWTPNWGDTLASQCTALGKTCGPKQVYMLVLDNTSTTDPEAGWQYLQGLANQPNSPNAAARPFQLPTFTVAGYWYKQSPNTINNCNNCLATGLSNVVGDPEAGYLLPVNVKDDGSAALDGSGNPIFVRDGAGNVVWETDYNGKRKPKIEGSPIDLTMVLEKYLKHLGDTDGGVTADNLPLNRIGLVSNDGTQSISLPDFTGTLGFPVMQPLCGTIGKDEAAALACPQ